MTTERDRLDIGWQAQLLRLTMFLAAPLDPSVTETLWKTATGADPEIEENRPREGIRHQGGPFGGCYLETIVASRRIDWVMALKTDPRALEPPYFGDFEKAMGNFRTAGKKWLKSGSPSVNRLAVGAVLLIPVASAKAALTKLVDMLVAVRVEPDHSLDFFYQVNWPRASSAMPQLRLNRLTRWSTLAIRSINFEMNESTNLVQSGGPNGQDYCQLECDHSTSTEHAEPFEPTELVEHLFDELCQMVEENAGRGEVVGTELI
jgi:hypothetical protein